MSAQPKRSRTLHISPDLTLPVDAVTSTIIVFGGKGMGKTNFLSVVAEELARAHQRFAILDPMGACWGLRHSADGKSDGIGVLILGGRRGDLPIEPTAGAVVADLVVDEDVSVVIDISRRADGRSWSKNEKIRFVRDYCTRLYERQGEQSRPLLQIIDEAARFIPQMVRANEVHTAECMGAIAQMVEEGRNVGLGVLLVTQRSARLNKDVSELADCMVAFRTIGPNSMDAVMDWLGDNVPKERWKDFASQLRTLPRGSALVVSPGWLEFEGVVPMRPRTTFDSSATPKAGEQRRTPGKAAPPDLGRYQQRMAETIEKAHADNPSELRKQIAALNKQLAAKPAPVAAPAPAAKAEKVERVSVPVLKEGQLARLEKVAALLREISQEVVSSVSVLASGGELMKQMAAARSTPPPPRPLPAQLAKNPATPRTGTPGDGKLGKCERAILAVLAAYHPDGCEKGRLTLLAGYRYSGGFRNSLSALRSAGYMTGDNEAVMRITDEGQLALGHYDALPSGRALVDYWLNHPSLGKCERAILRLLTDKGGEGFVGTELANLCGYEFSGGFRNALSTLRTAGLIVGDRNTEPMSAHPDLIV